MDSLCVPDFTRFSTRTTTYWIMGSTVYAHIARGSVCVPVSVSVHFCVYVQGHTYVGGQFENRGSGWVLYTWYISVYFLILYVEFLIESGRFMSRGQKFKQAPGAAYCKWSSATKALLVSREFTCTCLISILRFCLHEQDKVLAHILG